MKGEHYGTLSANVFQPDIWPEDSDKSVIIRCYFRGLPEFIFQYRNHYHGNPLIVLRILDCAFFIMGILILQVHNSIPYILYGFAKDNFVFHA